MTSTSLQYGFVTVLDCIQLLQHIVLLPLTIIITTLLRLLFPSRSRFKNETWKRTIGMAVLRYTFHRIPINQLQFLVGDSLQTYGSWTKYNDVPSTIDCLDMDTKLLWIGQKRTDRVILYLHGGAFLFGVPDFGMSFFLHYQRKLEKSSGGSVGIAVLAYTPAPDVVFPTNLSQMQIAISHLLEKENVSPENLQLFGDSASGHLVYQFISQILHPRDDLPRYELPSKLGGICLLSPGFDLIGHSWDLTDKSSFENKRYEKDCLSPALLTAWGQQTFGHASREHRAYFTPLLAPIGWLDEIGKISSRWLITAGAEETLCDPIVAVYERQFKPVKQCRNVDVQLYVQPDGIHEDGLLDFMFHDNPESNPLSQLVWGWLSNDVEQKRRA